MVLWFFLQVKQEALISNINKVIIFLTFIAWYSYFSSGALHAKMNKKNADKFHENNIYKNADKFHENEQEEC